MKAEQGRFTGCVGSSGYPEAKRCRLVHSGGPHTFGEFDGSSPSESMALQEVLARRS
jgi:hypothetical protein